MPELLVHCIRHGESTANAGGALLEDEQISLTEHGLKQAEAVARIMAARPVDFIAVSPYLRAQQTAAPTLATLSNVSHETWPDIREFSFLAKRDLKALRPERLEIAKRYWNKADPYFAEEGAESFRALLERATHAKDKLENLHAQNITRIAVFSHAYFLTALRWVIENPGKEATASAMNDFIVQYKERAIHNADILSFTYDGKVWKTGR